MSGIAAKNMDVMFMVDVVNFFYLSGVQGYSNSLLETIEKLSKLCLDKKYKKLYFIGTSMGGYGAILHALLFPKLDGIEEIKCLVFNPYTEIITADFELAKKIFTNEAIFYMQQRGIQKEACYKLLLSYNENFLSLKKVIKNYQYQEHGKTSIEVIYGREKVEIQRVSNLIGFKDLKLNDYDIKDHNIAGELCKQKLLTTIIKNFIKCT